MSLKKTKSATPSQPNHQSAALNAAIIEAMQNIKGLDIVELDLRHIPDASTDFFIVCTGTSTTHIAGIADRIEKEVLEKLNLHPAHTEGLTGRSWILIDYFTTVVHIFSTEKRNIYTLEYLWSDAKKTRHESESAEDNQEEYFD